MLSVFRLISPSRVRVNVRTNDNARYAFHLSYFFSEQKGFLDNKCVGNRLNYCQDFGNAILQAIRNPENNRRRQFLWDCQVILRFLQIQQLRDGGFDARKIVMDEMMENLPDEVDSGFAWLIYHVKIATLKVNEGDFRAAEQLFDDVLHQIPFCNNPFLKALVFHDGLYIFGHIFYETGNERYIDKAADMTYQAVGALNEGDSSIINFLGRLVLLQLVMIYLGIHRNASVDNERQLVPRYKASAAVIICLLRQNYSNMESRREVFLQLCQARLYEDDGKLEEAVICADRAKSLTEFGGYYPSGRENIESYCTRLVLKLLPPAL